MEWACQVADSQSFSLCILHRGRRTTVLLDLVADADCTLVHHESVPLLHTAVEIVSRQTDNFGGHSFDALVLVLVLPAPSFGLVRIGYYYNKSDLSVGCAVFQHSLRRQRVKPGTSSSVEPKL